MFKTLAFVKRKDGISRDEFRTYYETRHAALVAQIAPGARCYRRNYLTFGEPANVNFDELDFDVVTELEFSNRDEFERWSATMRAPEVRKQIIADMANFADPEKFRVCVVEVGQ